MSGKKVSRGPTVADAVDSTVREAFTFATEAPVENIPEGVFLPESMVEKILDLYGKLRNADAHFKTCQSQNFREYARSVLNAPKVVEIIDRLKTEINH